MTRITHTHALQVLQQIGTCRQRHPAEWNSSHNHFQKKSIPELGLRELISKSNSKLGSAGNNLEDLSVAIGMRVVCCWYFSVSEVVSDVVDLKLF